MCDIFLFFHNPGEVCISGFGKASLIAGSPTKNITLLNGSEIPFFEALIFSPPGDHFFSPRMLKNPTAGIASGSPCQHIHHAIVHAPLQFQGLGIPYLYVSQGISHIKAQLDAPPLEGITGNLLTCSMEDLKLELGLPGHVLQHNYK